MGLLETQVLGLRYGADLMRQAEIDRVTMMIGAKSVLPGFSKGKPKKTAGRDLPVERDDSGEEVQDERQVVSLHAYLKLPKGQKLTAEDLEKAERKAKKEGNEAILTRIAQSRRFILKKPGPRASGSKPGRGFAVYHGVEMSPKAPGHKPQKCLRVSWGGLDYYYLPGDGRTNLTSLDNKLAPFFKTNPTVAGVKLNEAVRNKKLLIYLRWDRAAKRVHEPVVASLDSSIISGSTVFLDNSVAYVQFDKNFASRIVLASDAGELSLDGVMMHEALASGSISLSNLRRSLFALGVTQGKIVAGVGAVASNAPIVPIGGLTEDEMQKYLIESPKIISANQWSPTKLYKERSNTGTVRTIEAESNSILIPLHDLDWQLVKAVAEDRMKKALVVQQLWTVTKRDSLIVFLSVKNSSLKVMLDADLLLYKLS
jgi:hypothetical protein